MRKSFLSALGCLALVLMVSVPAEAGLFRNVGRALFGPPRGQAGACGSAGSYGMSGACGSAGAYGSSQSFQSYQSFQSQSGSFYAAPPAYPARQAPPACQGGSCPTSQVIPAQPATSRPATAVPQAFDYINELNSFRAQYHLPPVGFDQQLYNDAMVNNSAQIRYGMGHFYMGMARRQNSGMGGPMSVVLSMWKNSPPHRAALLDPTIRAVAVANYGSAWTFAAR